MRPDGDMELMANLESFKVPDCQKCGGILKSHVVMFGENVRRDVVDACYSLVDSSDTVLALGTSLQVLCICVVYVPLPAVHWCRKFGVDRSM